MVTKHTIPTTLKRVAIITLSFSLISLVVISGNCSADASAINDGRPNQISGNNGNKSWTCSFTNPEYMIHAGGATLKVQPGTDKFTVTSAPAGKISDPYISTGYDVSLDSTLCNNRELPGGKNKYGKSYAMPVRLGKQGHIIASVHDVTSSNSIGDTGFDIWFTSSLSDNTYTKMADGGSTSTEIMIWLNHPGLSTQSSNLSYYPVRIDGRWWQVAYNLAANGHGKNGQHPDGWNVIYFIAPQISNGNVVIHNLLLNSFFSYAISHGWLLNNDYLMAIDQGGEIIGQGAMSVNGYTLTGVQ
jgi:hypothetical protein